MEKYFNINKAGYSISCKIYFADLKTVKKVVIYGHGFSGHKDNKAAEKFAEFVLKKYKDIAVITYNAPCHGDDVRKKLTLSDCMKYIELVTGYAEERFSPEAIFGYATSFGSYLLLKYIAGFADPFKKIALRCPAVNMHDVILDSIITPEDFQLLSKDKPILVGFDRKIKITKSFVDELDANDISELDYSPFAGSILIMHGTADELVPYDGVKAFAEKNGIRFIPVEKADHRFKNPVDMDNAIKAIVEFFEF